MSLGDIIVSLILFAHVVAIISALGGYFIRRALWKRFLNTESTPISIFKPLCGIDDDLEENLESFFNLDDNNYQLIFATSKATDSAQAIAKRLIEKYPSVDATLLVCEEDLGASPKVSLLMQMFDHAKHDLFLLSDSNVTVREDYLDYARVAFRNPKIGLAHNPVIGANDKNAMAAIEGSLITDTCGIICLGAKTLLNIDAITGKSMFVRREVIKQIGGLRVLRNLAADDQYLGIKTHQQGWKITLIPDPVESIIEYRNLKGLAHRHIRWSGIRLMVAPVTYPIEHLLRPMLIASLLFVTGFCSATIFASAVVTRYLFHIIGTLSLRGNLPSIKALIGLPVVELITTGFWFVPFFTNKVNWRGNIRCLTSGTRLVDPDVFLRATNPAQWLSQQTHTAILSFPGNSEDPDSSSDKTQKAA